jgi:acyl-CoA thioesterase I
MRSLAIRLLVSAFVALPLPSWAGGELGGACDAPDDLVTTDTSLPRFAAAVAAGGPVDVLAVGSATTVGSNSVGGEQTHVTSQNNAFPGQMVQVLHAALPRVEFHLTVRGGRGMTAEDMLPLLQEALKAQRYPLVIWQTGTVEAVRGLRPDGLLDILHDGAQQVREAGGDLVLIDPQFSRFLRANTDLDPYEGVMQQVATMPGVALFHRFELMRIWANDGRIDLERTQKADRDKALDDLNRCLGRALARFVLSGADVQNK